MHFFFQQYNIQNETTIIKIPVKLLKGERPLSLTANSRLKGVRIPNRKPHPTGCTFLLMGSHVIAFKAFCFLISRPDVPPSIQALFPLHNGIHNHYTRQATNIHFDPVSFGIRKRGFRHKISLFHDTHTDVDYTIPISSFKFVVKTTLLNQDWPEAEDQLILLLLMDIDCNTECIVCVQPCHRFYLLFVSTYIYKKYCVN